MSDKIVEELESFLLPFALKRFSFDSYKSNFPMGKMARRMAESMMGDWLDNMVTWQVRAYVRCLFNVSGTIYLKDLAAAVNAEASYMSGVGPLGLFQGGFGTQTGSNRSSTETMMEAEIHVWMLHLAENDKLPGNYERFTGKYTA